MWISNILTFTIENFIFWTFPFFGSKFQHFSTFGSNRNDHVLNQTRNSESGMLMHDHGVWFTTLAGLIFIKTVSMPKFSLPPWLELAYISPLQAKPYIEAACCLKNDLASHPPPPTPPTNLKCPQKPQITWFTTTKYKNNMGSVHILHYHVEGGRGFRTPLIALMVPFGGGGKG